MVIFADGQIIADGQTSGHDNETCGKRDTQQHTHKLVKIKELTTPTP